MTARDSITIPSTVRIKPGALDRLGVYLARQGVAGVALLVSRGLPPDLVERARGACAGSGIGILRELEVEDDSFAGATALYTALPAGCGAVVGLGGGKALDVAKYVAFLARLPYVTAPTSLSNDGFCSPRASLTVEGRKRGHAARLPGTVVIDTEVCLAAPEPLWWSGVGDLVAKITAVADWKLAFHAVGEPVNDFAALLGEATVYQFTARPERDLDGVRLLATALMLNGIAMEIAGSSRPASGGEHLISHALDEIAARPRLHGLQVGVASYVCARLQGDPAAVDRIDRVLAATGFWAGVRADPFSGDEWLSAVRLAPSLRPGYHTVLAGRDPLPEVERMLDEDERLRGCFG